ncbi:tetratricopeptide repeat protein [Pedobacter gandavensis]|uniref:tetratricopeptide repeat protein n=1 Tax=Pedobacter gandavensis TaxID=2679963 RepID=UPI00292D4B01|nr:tetratricopeptide repeat protein [Pedobacter gandavensis]
MSEEVKGAAPELSTAVADEILKLSESGNDYFDEDDFDSAIGVWEEALALIPEPQNEYIQSVWLNASIGDAHFLQDDFKTALPFFETAKSNTREDVESNPFVMLRLGQCYLEKGDKEKAKEYLLKAYELEPEDIFFGEEMKYYNFLKANADLKA